MTTDVPGYNVHQYLATGGATTTTSVTFSRDVVADVLVVGGGGSGGRDSSGGGGAGAVLYYSGFKFSTGTSYTFTVGGGGGEATGAGNTGTDSTIGSIFVAKGGGGGGVWGCTAGKDGGSGGGGGSDNAAGGTCTAGSALSTNVVATISGYTLGKAGGAGRKDTTMANRGGGGGGGAGAVGQDANIVAGDPGKGGDGISSITWAGSTLSFSSIFGSAYTNVAKLESDGLYYIAGGGGGGGYDSAACTSPRVFIGGKGGGGSGNDCAAGGTGGVGQVNTGSGGGGTGSAVDATRGGAGGSGLILLRYSVCQPCGAGMRLQNAGAAGSCTACMSGTYSGPGQSACSSCPADSGSPVAADKCYANAGKYPKFALSAYTTTSATVTVTLSMNQLLVINNDFVADTYWGLSGSVAINLDYGYPIIAAVGGILRQPYIWYKFDTGNCLADSSGNGYNAIDLYTVDSTNYGQFSCGTSAFKRGSASGTFVAASKHTLRLPTSLFSTSLQSMQNASGITICFWFRFTAGGTNYDPFFSFGENTALNTDASTIWRMWWHTDGRSFNIYDGTTSTTYTYATPASPDSIWHHYSWSIASGSASIAHAWTIYIDGVLVSSDKAAYLAAKSASKDWYYRIGSEKTSTRYITGDCDDFRIYQGVLTSAQVSNLYADGVGLGYHPSVLLGSPQIPPAISDNDYPVVTATDGAVVKPYVWYKFDSTGVGITFDSSGNGNTLTSSSLTGTPTPAAATLSTAKVKRGDSSALFVAASKNYFKIPSTDWRTVQVAGGLTFAFWGLMTSSTSGSSVRFLNLGVGTSATADTIYGSINKATNIQFYLDGVYWDSSISADSVWHHYVWCISASTGDWTIYIDNVKLVCPTGSTPSCSVQKTKNLPTGTSFNYFLGTVPEANSWLDGNIDDFRVYKGVLTDAQVTTLYQGRVGVYNATFGSCPDSGTSCVAGVNGSKHCDKFGGGVCCGAGKYLVDGSDSACQNCPAGTYSTDGSGTACTTCSAGTSSPSGSISSANCTGCGSATCSTGYKRCVNSSASVCCGQSNAQEYFVEGTHTACQTCPSGLFGDGSGTTCLDQCPAGQYMDGQCKLCPAGYYRATPGATSVSDCLSCASGTNFASSQGSVSCTPCSTTCTGSNYISRVCNTTSDITCSACTNRANDANSYAYTGPATGSAPQSSNCPYDCAAGAYRANTNYGSGSACAACSPGSFQNVTTGFSGTSCPNCSAGTYMATSGASACLACPLDAANTPGASQSQAGATFCVTSPGFFDSSRRRLLAYYQFNSQDWLADGSTYNRRLTVSPTSPTQTSTGPWGNGAAMLEQGSYNGWGSGVNRAQDQFFNVPTMQIPIPASVCLWYNRYDTGSYGCCTSVAQGVLFYTGNPTVADTYRFSISQYGTEITFQYRTASAAVTGGSENIVGAVPFNTWKHICVISSSTETVLSFDGQIKGYTAGSFSWGSTSLARNRNDTFSSIALGKDTSGTSTRDPWQGLLTEVRIYDKALTQADVTAIYNFRGDNRTAIMPAACDNGTFSDSTAQSACQACAAGSVASAPGLTVCTACAAGTFASGTGMSACVPCGAGSFANRTGASACTNCSVGKYSTGLGMFSELNCTTCAAGKFSTLSGVTVCGNCTASCGTGQGKTADCSASKDLQCGPCTNKDSDTYADAYTSGGTSTTNCAYNCKVGSYKSGSTCTQCGTGTYQDSNGFTGGSCTQCGTGKASTELGATTSGACVSCAPGKFQGSQGQSTCASCVAGTNFAANNGQTVCTSCNTTACPSGQQVGIPCNVTADRVCTACPTGKAGIGGTCGDCTTGKYSNTTGLTACYTCEQGKYQALTGQTDCSLCSAGKYGTGTGFVSETSCTNCSLGSFSAALGATSNATCSNCPAGNFLSGQSCNPCLAGTFTASGGLSACSPCGKGTFLVESGKSVCSLCPAGTASNSTGMTSNATCARCPAGSYGPTTGLSACTTCEAGKFQTGTGMSGCDLCGNGTFSVATNATSNATCQYCAAGRYGPGMGLTVCPSCDYGQYQSGSGLSACVLCAAGTYNPSQTSVSSASCIQCVGGKYQTGTGRTAETQCDVCGVGKYSTILGAISSSNCTNCSAGSVQPLTFAVNCTNCSAGTYQAAAGQGSCLQADKGYFVNAAARTSQSACSAGQFQNETGKTFCYNCSAGTYQAGTGFSSCTQASQGYFVASAGLSSQSACSAGQFQNETGKTFCYNCSAGTYQNGTGSASCTQASLGYFVASSGQSAQSACGGGTYSYLQGMTFCSLCRAGTYQPLTAQTAVSACQNCGAGKYSAVEGLNQSSGCLLCSNATYSTVADLNSSSGCKGCPANAGNQGGGVNLQSCVCNAGYSGANGGNCTLCNRTVYCMTGTANNCPQFSQALQTGASLITDCYCNAGYYGYALIAGTPCAYCPADSYCPGGAVNYTVACPYGQKAYGNSTSASACFCPPNAETGPGAYNENACTCKTGYKKITNASSPLFGWSCQLCAQGEICRGGINSTCPQNSQPPISGKVNNYLDCLCVPGFYNVTNQTETNMCQPCPANSYCLGGGHIAGCPGASTQVSPPQSPSVAFCLCLNGTAGIGNVTCSPCSAGKYCILGQELNCPQNMNSPASSTVVRNCSCNAGYYGDNGGACLSCPAGKYNLIQGCYSCQSKSDSDCVLCSIGTYSTALARNTTCDLCGTGKYLDLTGQDAEVDCKLCATGTYQTGSGMIAAGNCTACAAGYSQPLQGANGSSACLVCGKGTYQENSGQAACVPCGAGTYSGAVNASNASTCASCGPGTWSAAQGAQNSSACQNCSAGTYQTGTGMQASAKCLACAAGAFGSAVGLTTCSNCSAGGYSNSTGMSFCYDCSAGKYGTGVGSAAEAGCLLCAAGTYGTAVGSTACTPCGVGTFSPNQGSAAANVCQLCRVGTFQTGTGMPASANCSLCDAGTFQTGSGMPASANCSQCGAGTFQTGLGMPASANCSLCGLGTYQTGSGMPASANCSLCVAGTFQTGSGMRASANCSQCGAGLYQTGSGMQASANCSQCVAGTFQTGSGMSAASDCSDCGPGTYSVAKASSCKNCPSNSNSGSAATVCVVNAGFYNLGANQISFHPFNAENILADMSGKGNTLTSDGTTVGSTANGPWAGNDALALDGNGYLKIPNIYLDESYTFCVWHKFTGLTNASGYPLDADSYISGLYGQRTILNWACDAPCNAFDYVTYQSAIQMVYVRSSGLWSGRLNSGSAGAPRQFNAETWYHSCITGYQYAASGFYTGSSQQYPDWFGYPVAHTNGTRDVYIGHTTWLFQNWIGHLDDVRWFNKRINSDEYMAIYNSRDTYSNVLPVACPAGTYLTQAGATSISDCVLCGAGTFQTGTGMALASDCTACGAGTYQTGVGMTLASNCVQCGAGKVQNSTGAISESNCTNCTNGTFVASDKVQQCWPCPSNSTSPTGSDRCTCGGGFAGIILKSTDTCKQCTTCDPNAKTFGVCDFVTKFDNVSCACNAGYWGDGFACQLCKVCDGNAQQLATCPFNSTSDTAACGCQNGFFGDGLKCTACPQGTWGSGGTFCEPCGKGLYSDGTNQTSNATCLPCPKDTYAPREASGNQSAACLPCPQFSTTAGTGAKSRVDCKCAPGYLNFITETGGDCSGCGINEYPSESQGSCLPCPANTASPAGSVGIWQCAANAGYFARYTRTLNMIVEVPEEDSDPLVVEAVMRAAAGGGDDVTVVVANVTLP